MEMNCASFAKPSIETFATTIKIGADLLSQTRAQHYFICQYHSPYVSS